MGKVGRERDAEVAREAILDAAEEIFSSEGFDGARIDAIAAKAGYNKSLIFHYFDDKEGLYQTIVKGLKMGLNAEFSEALVTFVQSSEEMSPERVKIFLEIVVECYFTFLINNPRSLRIMAWEAAEGWRTFLSCTLEHQDKQKIVQACMATFIRRGQEAGIISKELDKRFLTMTLGNMCIMYLLNLPRYQWIFTEAVKDTPAALAYMRQQMVHLVLHGLLNSPQEGKTR